MASPTRVAVLGATGFTGEELVRILSRHPKVRLTYVSAKDTRSQKIQDIFPDLAGLVDLECKGLEPDKAIGEADLFFLSLPHTVSMQVAPRFLEKGKRVIDLSADYRLRDLDVFEKYYGTAHRDPEYLKRAVYGLPELYREAIRKAELVANPGCYPTSVLLALLPFLKGKLAWEGIAAVDSKSGVTGAGRKTAEAIRRSEGRENFKAYRVLKHQHEPEVAQVLKDEKLKNTAFVFVPHLLPLDRGILTTVYLKLKERVAPEAFHETYRKCLDGEPYVQLCEPGSFPELREVLHQNTCRIGVALKPETGFAVIVSVIDNLVKGAAGQAVQNMNLMLGLPETEAL